jgi:hypothetical protein
MEDPNKEVVKNIYEDLRNSTYQVDRTLTSFKSDFKIKTKTDKIISESVVELIKTLEADLIIVLDITDTIMNTENESDIEDLLSSLNNETMN